MAVVLHIDYTAEVVVVVLHTGVPAHRKGHYGKAVHSHPELPDTVAVHATEVVAALARYRELVRDFLNMGPVVEDTPDSPEERFQGECTVEGRRNSSSLPYWHWLRNPDYRNATSSSEFVVKKMDKLLDTRPM